MTFLDGILARKAEEVAARRAALPDRELAARARDAAPPRVFADALSARGSNRLIQQNGCAPTGNSAHVPRGDRT